MTEKIKWKIKINEYNYTQISHNFNITQMFSQQSEPNTEILSPIQYINSIYCQKCLKNQTNKGLKKGKNQTQKRASHN